MKTSISKSKYIAGLQCPKLLWTHYNDPKSIPEPDAAKLAIFGIGHEVGDLAKLLYPEGIEVPWTKNLDETVTATFELLAQRKPIFEASFLFEGGYCRADIMVPVEGDAWDLYEVKSATKVKGVNLDDVAFQVHVIEGSGVKLRNLYLTHINNTYVREGEIDVAGFFHSEDVTSQARDLQPFVGHKLAKMHHTITKSRPLTGLGEHCFSPYSCDLWKKCSSHLPEFNVLQFNRIRKSKAFSLMEDGFFGINEVPATELTNNQLTQQASVQSGRPQIIPTQIDTWLGRLKYPLYCIDFETMNSAVPLIDGTRPYQQVPFQFSLHIIGSMGEPAKHVEFLAEEAGDPRPGLVESLKAIGPEGTILAYNMSFEKRVIRELAEEFPDDGSFLHNLDGRFMDLMAPFNNFWFHDAAQHGSCSLKKVLPVLTETSYEGMTIGDGGTAMREFQRVVFTEGGAQDKAKVLAHLKEYCKQDTQALVDVLEALRGLV